MAAPVLLEIFWRHVLVGAERECWPWQSAKNAKGYGRLRSKATSETYSHRVAFRSAYGEIPVGQHVLHRCDNPACCNPKHLFLGSNLDNVADKVLKHRQARGKAQAKAVGRLSEAQVIGIFNAIGLQREIAKQFGVTQMLVSKIKRGVVWKHLCLNAK